MEISSKQKKSLKKPIPLHRLFFKFSFDLEAYFSTNDLVETKRKQLDLIIKNEKHTHTHITKNYNYYLKNDDCKKKVLK